MATWRTALIVTVVVFLLPFPITWLMKALGGSLGPVVLFYSLIAGAGSAFLWCRVAWQRINKFVALLIFVPAGIMEIILLINAFASITALMGAMNYEMM